MKRGLPGVKAPDKTLVIVARTGTDTKALTKNLHTLSAIIAVAESQVRVDGPARQRQRTCRGQRVFVLWRSYGHGSAEAAPDGDRPRAHPRRARLDDRRPRCPPGSSRASRCTPRATSAGERPARCSPARGCATPPSRAPPRRSLSLSKLAKPTALRPPVAVPLAFAYSYASAAAFTIAQKHGGAKALLRLYSAFNSDEVHGPAGPQAHRPRAAQGAAHVAESSLEDEVKAYARANSRRVLACSGDARAARSRDDPPPPGAPRRGAGAGGGGGPRRALVPPARAGGAGRRAPRPPRRAPRPARQVPRLGPHRRRPPAHAPAHDRARCCSTRAAAAPHAPRAARRSATMAGLRRPAAVRDRRAGARAGRARRVLRCAARRRAARARLHRRAPATRSRRPRARR